MHITLNYRQTTHHATLNYRQTTHHATYNHDCIRLHYKNVTILIPTILTAMYNYAFAADVWSN